MKKNNFTKLGILLLLLIGISIADIHKVDAQIFNQNFPRENLAARIKKIKKKAAVPISFDNRQMQQITAAGFYAKNYTVGKTLSRSLKGTGYRYQYKNDAYIIYKDTEKAENKRAKKGKVRGVILDENGELLPGASVSTLTGNEGAITNSDGKFSLELPAGTYTLEVSYIGYQPQQITNVEIAKGKTTPLDVKLNVLSSQLSEVVVTATYNQASAEGLYAKQKAIATMSDGVSAELIKKTSDNNVAQVLKRVSGVTIDKGKYVIVRGMSERYNNVQLNGASLPSTEPNRRNFSFDVIPIGLVDNVTIAKTFTPDLPGEFTGGLVQVNTLAIPREKLLKIGVGTGYNTLSTGKKFLSNKRFKSDYFLGEIDKRKWYEGYSDAQTANSIINAGNMNTFGMRKYTAKPSQSYSLTAGAPFHIGEQKLGIVAALTYRHNENRQEIVEGHMINRDSIYKPGNLYKFETSLGATVNLGWKNPLHKITLRNLFNNRFSHKNQERYTYESYGSYGTKTGGDVSKMYEQYSVPLVSRLFQAQLDGEHKLFKQKLIFTWNASYNKIKRTNPDNRLALGAVVGESAKGEQFIEWTTAVNDASQYAVGENHIMYSGLGETKKNLGANIEFPFEVLGNMQKLKAGYLGTFREANFQQQYLRAMSNNPGFDNSIVGVSLEEFFAPKNFEKGKLFHYAQAGVEGNKATYYMGTQRINAWYAMTEFSFFKKLRLISGVRMEHNNTQTLTRMTIQRKKGKGYKEVWVDSTYVFKETDLLPAAALVYSLTPELNLRASYSKTLARPDFRELSFVNYYNVDDRLWVINLEPIKQSYTYNYDARLEWYPRAGEVLSLSFFYKDFHNPVERLIRVKEDQQNFILYNVNLDKSIAKGIELNWRKSLGFISSTTNFLNDLYFTGNFTWMNADVSYNRALLEKSKLKLTDEQKKKFKEFDRKRPLEGLSPYSINAGLSYQGSRIGAAVNYNRNGRKLVLAGEYQKYDQYLKSRDVLDLQFSVNFLQKHLEIKFNASDLLNQDVITYMNTRVVDYTKDNPDPKTGQVGSEYLDLTDDMDYNKGDWIINRFRKGMSLSLSATYKF